MEVGKIFELATRLKTVESGMKVAMELMKDIEKSVVKPTTPLLDAERLDRIWKRLQAFMSKDVYAELREWAVGELGYKYYGGTQRYPVDLRTTICVKLRGFTELQIVELEKILEAK